MFGAALMRGERLGKPVSSRVFEERYPKSLQVDFRRLEDSTLKKYCNANAIEYLPTTSSSELACLVAKHFEQETRALLPSEEDVILRGFSEYVMNFCGGNTLEDVKNAGTSNKRRLRKKTRRNNSVHSDQSEEENANSADDLPASSLPPAFAREVTGRAAAAAAAAAAQAQEADSQNEEDEVFCVCRGPSYGEMIGCDNENCQGGEWFHVGCVGVKPGDSHSDQKWYCPTCVQLQ